MWNSLFPVPILGRALKMETYSFMPLKNGNIFIYTTNDNRLPMVPWLQRRLRRTQSLPSSSVWSRNDSGSARPRGDGTESVIKVPHCLPQRKDLGCFILWLITRNIYLALEPLPGTEVLDIWNFLNAEHQIKFSLVMLMRWPLDCLCHLRVELVARENQP